MKANNKQDIRRWFRRRGRGAALLFALMVLMVMSISGLALAAGSLNALRTTRLQEDSSMAFNVAEAGSERALLWLRQQSSPPAGTTAFNPFTSAQTLGNGTYTVTIVPDSTNASVTQKKYLIRSKGVVGTRQETVEVYVQLGTFGRYAYFTDYETSSSGSSISFKAGNVVDGPAHSNNTGGSDFQINYAGGSTTDPIFEDEMTGVSTQIDYAPGAPTTENDYRKIWRNGSRGYRLGVNRIELPDTTSVQKNAAWGNTSGFPTTTGAYFNASGSTLQGGIYLVGDAGLNFSVTTEGWQKITITQGSTTTTVTIKRSTNQTVVQKGSSTTTYIGTGNGVIYSTGNITSLKGELADSQMSGNDLVERNAFTIATDVVNNKDVVITNNLYYRTAPDKTKSWDDPVNLRSAALGVVARNIELDASTPTNLTVHGVMLAGGRNTTAGSFFAENYDSRTPRGELYLTGGVIQKRRGAIGTFDPNTGAGKTGFNKNYSYDPRMAVMPPPFFPTTGIYDRLSWMRSAAGPAN